MVRVVKAIAGKVRHGRAALAVAVLLGASGAARADGLLDFLNHAFGEDHAPASSAPLPQPAYADPGAAPPLTVRAHPRRPRAAISLGGAQRYNVADIRNVTIYTDKTLMRGDAVMTPTGIKVFTGSPGLSHTDDDFVSLEDADKMSKGMRKELTAMNDASLLALH